MLDPGGRFLLTNEAFRDVLGYLDKALIGEELLTLIHPDDAGEVRTFLAAEGTARSGFR